MTRTLAVVIATVLLALTPISADASARPVLRTAGTPVGIVVTGPNGHSVYRFDLDHRGTRRSACTGTCLRAWRPVTYAGTARTRIRTVGLTARAGSIPAAHGRRQITVAGWPLYYYVGDDAPGQVNGHGSGGVWWPVAPDGSRIKQIPIDKPMGTTPTSTPSSCAASSYTLATCGTSLGTIIVDGRAMTVYRYGPEAPNDATCAACSAVWPAVRTSGSPTVDGITGTVTVAVDGQVMINGYRLYTFSGDTAPGETNGNGSGGVWHAVAPTGEVK